MTRASTEFHEKASFRIKHDDERFFTKLLSKETSKSQPSFRVYYGDVSSAVPFTWETIPGTPKHRSHEDSDLPPLTPPPSYYTNGTNKTCKRISSSRSKLLLHQLLHALTLRKVVVHPKKEVHAASYPSSSSSLSSLSWSSSSSSSENSRRRRRFSSWGSSFDDRAMVDNPSEEMRSGPVKKVHGCYYSSVKKALLSVVGRGSN